MTKIKVAFADNHITVLEAVSMYLKKAPDISVVIKAKDGEDLINEIERSHSIPDICLVDIKMPGLDGFDTVRVLKEKWPQIKTIIFSGFLYKGYLEKMILLGVESYLSKDIHPEELIKAIRIVYEDGVYYHRRFNLEVLRKYKNNPSPYQQLTELESRLLFLILKGYTYSDIAIQMNKTVKSIESLRCKLFNRLDVNNKVELVISVLKSGYIELNDKNLQ